MSIIGSFSLKILNNELNFEQISSNLKLQATDIFRKGETFGNKPRTTENDVWYYEVEFEEYQNPNDVLEKLLSILKPSSDYLKELSKSVDVRIRCVLSSDFAQIYTLFSEKVIQEMAILNVKFELSILSFGEVET